MSNKVLKVTKADATIHVVPVGNKATYEHMNARILGPHEQMKLEIIDEKEAEKLPFIDESFVSVKEAPAKVSELEKEISRLKAQLASNANQNVQRVDPASASNPYVAEPPIDSKATVGEFTEQIKSHPEANAPETNSVIEKKVESVSATNKAEAKKEETKK